MSPWRKSGLVLTIGQSETVLQFDGGARPGADRVVRARHDGALVAAAASVREVFAEVPKRARLRVIVSDEWVRYRVLPWRGDLFSEPEWKAYASQLFAQANVPLGDGWAVHLSPATYGQPRLAVAIAAQIERALTAGVQERAIDLLQIGTKFLDCVEHTLKGRSEQEAAVGFVGGGRLTMARFSDGCLQTVQSLRFSLIDATSVNARLSRQQLMLTGGAEVDTSLFGEGDGVELLRKHGTPVRDFAEIARTTRPTRKPSSLSIQVESTRSGRDARAMAAVAMLVPVVVAAAYLSVLRDQSSQLATEVARIEEVRPRARSPAEAEAAGPMSASTRASAATVGQWMSVRWEPALRAIESTLPASFEVVRVNLDSTKATLTVEAVAPEMADVSKFANELTQQGWDGARVTQISADRSRRTRPIRFQMSVPWMR